MGIREPHDSQAEADPKGPTGMPLIELLTLVSDFGDMLEWKLDLVTLPTVDLGDLSLT